MPVTSELCSRVKLCGEEAQNIFMGVDERHSVGQKDAPQEFGVDLGSLNVNPPPPRHHTYDITVFFPKKGGPFEVSRIYKEWRPPRALAATM